MSREKYHIEFLDIVSGESHMYDTSSDFLAEKMVRNVISFSVMNNSALYKTKLKVIKYRKDDMHCCVTLFDNDSSMFVMDLYYN